MEKPPGRICRRLSSIRRVCSLRETAPMSSLWGTLSRPSVSGLEHVEPPFGRGAFGYVCKASIHGYPVVAKFYHEKPDTPFSQEKIHELQKEAAMGASKRHKHIATCLGFSLREKCIVTEYYPNGSLHDFLHTTDPSRRKMVECFELRLTWLEQIASAFVCLHFTKPFLIHRDLKPSNVYLDEHCEAKVGDFGLARMLDVFDDFMMMGQRGRESGLLLLYQPPEVMSGTRASSPLEDSYSKSSDVWSFGVLMQEVITLQHPYGLPALDEAGIWSVVFAVMQGRKEPEINSDRSALPGRWEACLEDLVSLMRKCCDRNPEARPDFKEIYAEIKRIKAVYARTQCPDEAPTRVSVNRATMTVIACTLLLVILTISSLRILRGGIESGGITACENILTAGSAWTLFFGLICRFLYSNFCRDKKYDEDRSGTDQPDQAQQEQRLLQSPQSQDNSDASQGIERLQASAFATGPPWQSSLTTLSQADITTKQRLQRNPKRLHHGSLAELELSPFMQQQQSFPLSEGRLQRTASNTIEERAFFRERPRSLTLEEATQAWKEFEKSYQSSPNTVLIDIPPADDPFAAGPSSLPVNIPIQNQIAGVGHNLYHGHCSNVDDHEDMFQPRSNDIETPDDRSTALSACASGTPP